MKPLIAVAIAVMLSLLVAALSPLTGAAMVPSVLLVGAVAAGVAVAGGVVARYRLARHAGTTTVPSPLSVPQTIARTCAVIAGVLLAEGVVVAYLPAVIPSFLLVELGYYCVLFAAGVVLARWCRAPFVVPAMVALLVLVIVSTTDVIGFVGSPDVDFQYGPEKWLFAMGRIAGRMAMLSLDVAVMVAGWQIWSWRRPGTGEAQVGG